jgi:hypothetical protein
VSKKDFTVAFKNFVYDNSRMGAAHQFCQLTLTDIRQAMQLEALKNIRLLINTAWFAIIITPVVSTLMLRRVW